MPATRGVPASPQRHSLPPSMLFFLRFRAFVERSGVTFCHPCWRAKTNCCWQENRGRIAVLEFFMRFLFLRPPRTLFREAEHFSSRYNFLRA